MTLTLTDMDTGAQMWRGAWSDFAAANADDPETEEARASLDRCGRAVMGGGAAPAVLLTEED